jgi:hypothetical protein
VTSGLALSLIVTVVGLGVFVSLDAKGSDAGKLAYFAGLAMFLLRIGKLGPEVLRSPFSASSIAFTVCVFGLVMYFAFDDPKRAEAGRMTFLAALFALLALAGDRVIFFGV